MTKRKINACMFCACPHNLSKHVISRARVGRLCTTKSVFRHFIPTSKYHKVTYILTGARHGRYPLMAPRVYDPAWPVSLVREPSTQNIGLIKFIMIFCSESISPSCQSNVVIVRSIRQNNYVLIGI